MVVREDHPEAGRFRPLCDLAPNPADIRGHRGHLRRDDVVETGLPVTVKAVFRIADDQGLVEFRPWEPRIVLIDGKQVGVFRDTPAAGILLVDHAIDCHHHALAGVQDGVGIRSIGHRIVPENVLRGVPTETVHPKLVQKNFDVFLDVSPNLGLLVTRPGTPRRVSAAVGVKVCVGGPVEVPDAVLRRIPVVVHHIELDFHPAGMCCFDKALQPVRSTVSGLDGKGILRIVSPTEISAELAHRHECDDVDPQPAQVIKTGDGIVEGCRTFVFGVGVVEAADVQLIHHLLAERHARSGHGAPVKKTVVVYDRVAVAHPHRTGVLTPSPVRVAGPAEVVFVFLTRPRGGVRRAPISGGRILRHGRLAPGVELSPHRHTRRVRRPDTEYHAGGIGTAAENGGAERLRTPRGTRSDQCDRNDDYRAKGHSERVKSTRHRSSGPALTRSSAELRSGRRGGG